MKQQQRRLAAMKRPGCTIIGTVVARPEAREEVFAILAAMVGPTRTEAGNISYDFHCDRDDPNTFVFYENFVNDAALDLHIKMPYIEPIFERTKDLLARPVEIRYLTLLHDRAA
jgi:quinol monooxygenase YgiN